MLPDANTIYRRHKAEAARIAHLAEQAREEAFWALTLKAKTHYLRQVRTLQNEAYLQALLAESYN